MCEVMAVMVVEFLKLIDGKWSCESWWSLSVRMPTMLPSIVITAYLHTRLSRIPSSMEDGNSFSSSKREKGLLPSSIDHCNTSRTYCFEPPNVRLSGISEQSHNADVLLAWFLEETFDRAQRVTKKSIHIRSQQNFGMSLTEQSHLLRQSIQSRENQVMSVEDTIKSRANAPPF